MKQDNSKESCAQRSRTDQSTYRPSEVLKESLRHLHSPRQRQRQFGHSTCSLTGIGVAGLKERLASIMGETLIVSISHDDYVVNYGGVQTLIGDEEEAFRKAHWAYLHISPVKPLLLLDDRSSADSFYVSLRLNGVVIGLSNFADLITALASRRDEGGRARLICHHLLGHSPELIGELHHACSTETAVFWIHDFFTLCPNYALMRNDVAFCHAPALDSAACGICCYGDERAGHVRRINVLFETLKPLVLAPSEPALSVWETRNSLPHEGCTALPHVRVVLAEGDADSAAIPERRPIRVAHLGAPATLKGWHVFKELALRFRDDPRYAFLYLGSERPEDAGDNVRHVTVRVTPTDRHAMVEAIAEACVDVVMIWSLAFETFSYVAHEALAGGAFVITRFDSGNVWPAVASIERKQGLALNNEQDLFDLFQTDNIRRFLERSRRRRGAVIPGGGTAHWLLYGAASTRSVQYGEDGLLEAVSA